MIRHSALSLIPVPSLDLCGFMTYCKVAERWDFHFWVSFEGKNTELTPH
jgi:hypothetical protein